MRNIDISSWQSIAATLVGLVLVTLVGVGIRLAMMLTVQRRRERMNRQINERLRTLIAAYRAIGGSFTGDLAVDPRHLRELRSATPEPVSLSDRPRRIRDAVEAALSDIILLGTEQQVRLATQAVNELVAGRPVHTHELVVSLRAFIRDALDLDPIPRDLAIPPQGPTRPSGAGGKNDRGGGNEKGGGSGGAGAGLGMGMGAGLGLGGGGHDDNSDTGHHS
ncbi:hypothetical protein P6144_18770 [Sphingomonas sp. HITSZ_GF]|uniref:hypothetical protein n=1 Tax=Sphingomonas sp. HITSZ_GF TaxID=3037247 RepID=UPI00240D0302|nr:hypothetical protein [Sphingomonas sp. HITSZ_GF]MDG2535711.1 hypothetical protein [Sphingomonas sp. HITSZ_GF]